MIIFDGSGKTCPKYQKQQVGNILAINNKKELQLLFCPIVMQNIQIFYWGPAMFVVACLQFLHWQE